jgi:acyl-lipid omega-6 desaturase (Delta-12 desaturase)
LAALTRRAEEASMHRTEPPNAAQLMHLKPSNAIGALIIGSCFAFTLAALWLSARASTWLWLGGQVLFALALVQWFAVLHECGHETLFRSKRPHSAIGHIAGFFSLIPFHNWKRVHGRHHKWTGWQDVDPTTASLVPRKLAPFERVLVNVCWKLWVPLFSVLYRINNFWNWPRLKALFPRASDRARLATSSLTLLAIYVAMFVAVGAETMLRLAGLGLLLALVAEDLLLLSQHTHIPQKVSGGEPVRPFPAVEQEVFTRSLAFPRWLSALLLHIDAHELHHMYPYVPGYRLSEVAYTTENEIGLWAWIRGARGMPGELLLFHNRLETGADI